MNNPNVFDHPALILVSETGDKIFQVGEIDIDGYLDKLVKVMRPDGTYLTEQPVALQRFFKFSGTAIWRRPTLEERKEYG